MRVYIAGPMKGKPGGNARAFELAAKRLREYGLAVTSPLEVGQQLTLNQPNACQQDFLTEDIRELLKCNAIHLLNGWEESCGATCEAAIAKTLGFTFLNEKADIIQAPLEIRVHKSYAPREPIVAVPE